MSEWREVPIGDLCAGIFDGPHATPKKTMTGPVFLGISNLNNGRLDLSDTEHLSEQDFVTWTRRIAPKAEDVVFSYETRLGQAAIIPDGLGCCLGRRMALMRPNPQKVDSRFLLYAYLGPFFQEVIRSRTIHGSTVDRIPLIDFPKFPIRVPDLPTQRAIAHVLGTLDDKIELNRRMNQMLEEMARTIFESWVVDNQLPRARIADLICSRTLDIGDGYRAKNSELGESGLPFIRAGNLKGGFDTTNADLLCQESVKRVGAKVSRVGDVAFTSKGTIGRFARVTEFTERFVYSPQVCYWRSLDPNLLHPIMLYCWMQSDDLRTQILAVASQTDMAPYVSLQDQRQMNVPIFPPSQHAVAHHIESLLARQSLCVEETKILAVLRDLLLPKLLSGELRIPAAERCVAEVRV